MTEWSQLLALPSGGHARTSWGWGGAVVGILRIGGRRSGSLGASGLPLIDGEATAGQELSVRPASLSEPGVVDGTRTRCTLVLAADLISIREGRASVPARLEPVIPMPERIPADL